MIRFLQSPAAAWRGYASCVALGLGAALSIGSAHGATAWKPEKAIQFIAPNAAGGGADRILRIMVNVLQERGQTDATISVVNKPGGGGAVAYNYLNLHPGNGHLVALGSRALLTNNLVGQGPSYTELTPVAKLFDEYISVTVRPDSPIKNGKELIERLRKDPAALSVGIATSLGGPNHQGLAAVLKAAGVDIRKMRTVIFPSGGAATTAMLGGHIDVVPITAAFAASMLRQGQIRMLAVGSPTRLTGVLAEVPNWREQGFDVVVSNWRAMFGAKGLSEAQIAYWEEALRRLIDSDEWKKELEANFWTTSFLRGSETRKFLGHDQTETRAFLIELGLAK